MIAYPPALRSERVGPPRAIRRFGDAIAEARAASPQARPAPAPVVRLAPVRLQEQPAHPRRVVVRLWLPATLLFLALAPFAIILSPLGWFVPRKVWPRPVSGVFILGRALLSTGGTVVDVDTPDARVLIRIF
jgi:hypothetical protein